MKRRMALEPYIVPAELSERWAVHKATISRLVQRGELPAMRVGRQLRIKTSEVERFERINQRRLA